MSRVFSIKGYTKGLFVSMNGSKNKSTRNLHRILLLAECANLAWVFKLFLT
jgi:hypothetical protein